MQRSICILLCLLCLLVTAGCGNSQGVEASESTKGVTSSSAEGDENMNLIDIEYLLNHSDLTEDDLVGIDVNDFISNWNLTKENVSKLDIRACLETYKEKKGIDSNKEDLTDIYEPLFEASPQEIGKEDLSQISIVAFRKETATISYTVFDFENNRLCISDDRGRLISRRPLTEDDKVQLIAWLSDQHMDQWKTVYEKEAKGEWPFEWDLIVKFEDQTVVHYTGKEDAPAAVYQLPDAWNTIIINKSFLLSNSSLQEKDLENVNIADFVQQKHLTPSIIDRNAKTLNDILKNYQDGQ